MLYYYITISLVFILLAYAVILLFKNAIFFMQRIKDLPEKESEFIYKLVSEGKPKLDKKFQMDDFAENQTTGKKAFRMERTNNGLAINEVHTAILEKIKGLSEKKMQQLLNYLDEGKTNTRKKEI